MKKIIKALSLNLILLLSAGMFSCTTMQDDIYIDSIKNDGEISVFERRFVELDSLYFDGSNLSNEKWQSNASLLLADIDTALKDVSLNKAATARLYSIAGCLSFDMGSKSRAKNYYESAAAVFKGDERNLILAFRLGIEKDFQSKMDLFSDKSLLTLENALYYFSKDEYAKAVANFDEAFLSLDSFYRTAYSNLRETSWNLRNMTGSTDKKKAELLALPKLSVMQMVLLTNQDPEILFNFTAGKNISDKDLFKKISDSGLLNPASQAPSEETALTKNSPVTRAIAARFLWNLYNHRKNTQQNLTKYSEVYRARKSRSPVLDVKVDSPDFDAILGCVENEIMTLEDGLEFGADKEINGIDFNESVKKIK